MNEAKIYYIDTSALLPYYREEPASQKIQDILLSLTPPLFITDLTKVEFASALSRWVCTNELADIEANLIDNAFMEDINAGLYRSHSLTSSNFRVAEKWLNSRKTSLRALDALHLASCFSLKAELITCDTIFYQAAELLGISTLHVKG